MPAPPRPSFPQFGPANHPTPFASAPFLATAAPLGSTCTRHPVPPDTTPCPCSIGSRPLAPSAHMPEHLAAAAAPGRLCPGQPAPPGPPGTLCPWPLSPPAPAGSPGPVPLATVAIGDGIHHFAA